MFNSLDKRSIPLSLRAILPAKAATGNNSRSFDLFSTIKYESTLTVIHTYFVGILQLILLTLGRLANPGQRCSFGAPSTLNIFAIWSASPSPGKMGSPVNISAKMQPIDHMSIGVEYNRDPNSNSGERSKQRKLQLTIESSVFRPRKN